MATTISGNVDTETAARLRSVAALENRSVSNVVASAVAVFTDLPKGLRDLLLELHARRDEAGLKRISREMMAAVARLRLESATDDLVADQLFGGPDDSSTESDVLQEATRLTNDTAG
jgi:hypothetical protein